MQFDSNLCLNFLTFLGYHVTFDGTNFSTNELLPFNQYSCSDKFKK